MNALSGDRLSQAVGPVAGSMMSGIDWSQAVARPPAVRPDRRRVDAPASRSVEASAGQDDSQTWLSIDQLAERLNVSTRTIRRRMDDAGFPQPSGKLGVPRWRWSEVVAWMESDRKA